MLIVHEHKVGIHERSLLVGRVDLEESLAVRRAFIVVANSLMQPCQCDESLLVLCGLLKAVHVCLDSRVGIADPLFVVLA